MKGTLEIHFPSMREGKGLSDDTVTKESSNAIWARNLTSLLSARVRIGNYFEILKKEHALKLCSPTWGQFSPSRVALRLQEDWFDNLNHAVAFGRYFGTFDNSSDSEEDLLTEVILPANQVSRVHKRSEILGCSLLTISDLYSSDSKADWGKCEGYASLAKSHELFGLEFQVGRWHLDHELIRRQLRIASILRPHFIRLVQRPGEDKNLFCLDRKNGIDGIKGVSLSLEAFATLEFEPVALYPHTVILSCVPELDWKQLGVPSRLLGLGVGAISHRADAASRVVTSKNGSWFGEYRHDVLQKWKSRKLVSRAQVVPLVHETIEKELVQESGLSYREIEDRFGLDLEELHPGLTRVLEDAGLVEQAKGRVVLTEQGRMRSDEVARNFFVRENDIQKVP